jgi:dCTP deaminase
MISQIRDFRPGVLSREQIKTLISQGFVEGAQKEPGFSSLNLHLGNTCWVMKGGIKCSSDIPYSEVLKNERWVDEVKSIHPRNGLDLNRGTTYVIQLQEGIRLRKDSGMHAYATGKSSIGRLDVLTRLITDHGDAYDTVPEGSSGSLYVEVTPITFPIRVRPGLALNQIRFFRGKPSLSKLSADQYELYPEMLAGGNSSTPDRSADDHYLHLDLRPLIIGGQETSAFQAVKQGAAIDLSTKNKPDPHEYWVRIPWQDEALQVEPESFYILRSKERFKLPEDVAVYAHAILESLGEIRIHYAGFVHPGFGLHREDGRGTPLIFEVRGHNVKTFLRHGEKLARISFYKMSEPFRLTAEEKREEREHGYDNQELTLSNHFASWDSTAGFK